MDRRYRLAALDMDGTLLNSEHEITPYSRAVLRRASEAGKAVALCTGRCLSELREHLSANPGIHYVIGENGACLYDVRERRVVRQIALPAEVAERVLEASMDFDVCRQIFLDNQSCIDPIDEADAAHYHIGDLLKVFRSGSLFVGDLLSHLRQTGAGAEKINLYFASEEERRRFRPLIEGMDVRISESIGIGYEISPAKATKGAGLRALCEYLGVPVEETLAVGDGGNDLDLMREAGLPVAMGNAVAAVRSLARAFTDDCDHDGAAKAVEAYLLDGAGN